MQIYKNHIDYIQTYTYTLSINYPNNSTMKQPPMDPNYSAKHTHMSTHTYTYTHILKIVYIGRKNLSIQI